MFTKKDRKEKIDELIDYFKTFKEIKAILLLGSGVYGFKDQYSDIDLSVVVSNMDEVKFLFNSIMKQLKQDKPCILSAVYKENSHYILIYLGQDLLEINISIVNKEIFKLKNEVQLIFKSDDFEINQLGVREEITISDLCAFVQEKEYIEHCFYFLKHVIVYTLRKDYMNACIYMANIRELMIQIYGLKSFGKLVSKNDMVSFSEDFIFKFQKTFTSVFSQNEFITVIDHTYELLFDLIDDERICLKEDYSRYQMLYKEIKRLYKY